ncbi:MAG: hypothetical protein EU532_09675 [Promethearchaeota archaeon]|nr:MAG: hypothetical protein EU532_09675 [Candidatus Lokiarchaeota archaeon]
MKSEKIKKIMESEKIKKVMESEKIKKIVESFPIPRKWPISVVSGLFAIITFWSFAFISMAHFPGVYNPFVNWMSNLGNSKLNPEGAIYFNIGIIIAGIALFPFFIGLYEWYIGGPRNKRLTILTQLAGFYCAFAMIMCGIYPENYFLIHIFWSMSLFIMSVFTFLFPSIALYKYKFTRSVAIFGFSAAAVNLVLWIFIIPIMEWVTILLSFLFIGVIVHSMKKRIERLRMVRKQGVVIPSKKKRKKKK